MIRRECFGQARNFCADWRERGQLRLGGQNAGQVEGCNWVGIKGHGDPDAKIARRRHIATQNARDKRL